MTQDDLTKRLELAFEQITEDIIANAELCDGCSDRLIGTPATDTQPEEGDGCRRVENYGTHCKFISNQLRENFR